jgi:hypothetical protein
LNKVDTVETLIKESSKTEESRHYNKKLEKEKEILKQVRNKEKNDNNLKLDNLKKN